MIVGFKCDTNNTVSQGKSGDCVYQTLFSAPQIRGAGNKGRAYHGQ